MRLGSGFTRMMELLTSGLRMRQFNQESLKEKEVQCIGDKCDKQEEEPKISGNSCFLCKVANLLVKC